ncbi:MAG: alkaline phosphatase D family protein [Chloroflexota bacterium]
MTTNSAHTTPKIILGPLIGSMTSTSAKLWARTSGEATLYAWIASKPDLSDIKLYGKTSLLTAETGFVGTVHITGLQPETTYWYQLTLQDIPPTDPEQANHFTTFPLEDSPTPFTFAFGSCIRLESPEADMFKVLGDLTQSEELAFNLLIGDQVYADISEFNGIGKIAESLSDYRELYLLSWQRKYLQKSLANLPVFMTSDDHEVEDDWRWADEDLTKPVIPKFNILKRWLTGKKPRHISIERLKNALQAYFEHQVIHSPNNFPINQPFNLKTFTPTYYSFDYGQASFFVMDTRTRRTRSFWHWKQRNMLGEDQWEALIKWLTENNSANKPKFIVTSSGFLTRHWVDIFNDRWRGFGKERNRLLNLLADMRAENVVLLSGDLHSSSIVSGKLDNTIPIWEFCCSPIENKPERITKYTFSNWPLRRVRNIKRHHYAAENCWGIVQVTYDESGMPNISYDIRGNHGSSLIV